MIREDFLGEVAPSRLVARHWTGRAGRGHQRPVQSHAWLPWSGRGITCRVVSVDLERCAWGSGNGCRSWPWSRVGVGSTEAFQVGKAGGQDGGGEAASQEGTELVGPGELDLASHSRGRNSVCVCVRVHVRVHALSSFLVGPCPHQLLPSPSLSPSLAWSACFFPPSCPWLSPPAPSYLPDKPRPSQSLTTSPQQAPQAPLNVPSFQKSKLRLRVVGVRPYQA